MSIYKAILISLVILLSMAGFANSYVPDNVPGMVTFYTTTEGNYSLTMQYGNTIAGSQGQTYINDYFETGSVGGNNIIVDLHYDDGRAFHGVYPSTIDGFYDITPEMI